MKIDCRDPRWHLLYVDTLIAKGEMGTLPNLLMKFAIGSLMPLEIVWLEILH